MREEQFHKGIWWYRDSPEMPWASMPGYMLTLSYCQVLTAAKETLMGLDAEFGPRIVDVNFPLLRRSLIPDEESHDPDF